MPPASEILGFIKQRRGPVLTAAIVIALLIFAFWPEPVSVDGGVVEQGPMEVTVTYDGRTRIRDIFTVSAPVVGRVLRVNYDPGDSVSSGETVVAIFEPVEPGFLDERAAAQARADLDRAKANTARARAELVRAEAELTYAKTEYDRAKALPIGGAITQSNLDLKKADFEARHAAVTAAEAAVRNAQSEEAAAAATLIVPGGPRTNSDNESCCLKLFSPADGNVLRVLQKSERVVPAGTPILEVGDPSDLEIEVDLLSQDAVLVREGAPVRIENWGGAKPLNGRVRRVEPSGFTKISALGVEEQRVNVIIDFTDPHEDWKTLRDSYRVEPKIVVWQEDDVLKAPLSALFRARGEWAVYKLVGNRAELHYVEIGQRNTTVAQILSGLSAGDQVIAHPSERVTDGVRVELR